MAAISILSLLASTVTLFAVWGNITSMYFNWKTFRKGGIRITYMSEAYKIIKGNLDGEVISEFQTIPLSC